MILVQKPLSLEVRLDSLVAGETFLYMGGLYVYHGVSSHEATLLAATDDRLEEVSLGERGRIGPLTLVSRIEITEIRYQVVLP